MVRNVLRLEALVVLAASIYFYFTEAEGGVLMFALLLLAPDVSLLGYVTRNGRLGAAVYNAMHNHALAVGLIAVGYAADVPLLTELGLILAVHVAMDRLLGYGLKYPSHFKHTHMQAV